MLTTAESGADPGGASSRPNGADIVIRARPDDSLVWSFPVWLICKACGIPVRLGREEADAAGVARDRAHLAPQAWIGPGIVGQLMAILETLHECHPSAGVWPIDRTRRAQARDACAAIVEICAGASPFVLQLPDGRLGVDASIPVRLGCVLDGVGHGMAAGSGVTAAVATLLLPLLGVRGVLSRRDWRHVENLLRSEAALSWFELESIRRRHEHFAPLLQWRRA
jgi:glutathione S-transferase